MVITVVIDIIPMIIHLKISSVKTKSILIVRIIGIIVFVHFDYPNSDYNIITLYGLVFEQ